MTTAHVRALRTGPDLYEQAGAAAGASGAGGSAELVATLGSTTGTERILPVLDELGGLLPNGLRRGSALVVEGSMSLALAVLAGPSAAGRWAAVVGVPEVGIAAAVELGADLDRLVLVPRPGDEWATVVAALADAIDVILVRPPGRVGGPTARRLTARARQRGAALVSLADWEGAELRLTQVGQQWYGLGAGWGRLRGCSLTVRVHGRGVAAVPREHTVWLPGAPTEAPSLADAFTHEGDLRTPPHRILLSRRAGVPASSSRDPRENVKQGERFRGVQTRSEAERFRGVAEATLRAV